MSVKENNDKSNIYPADSLSLPTIRFTQIIDNKQVIVSAVLMPLGHSFLKAPTLSEVSNFDLSASIKKNKLG